jgi:peptide/nickel transport system substrate-binding protein
MTMGETVKGLRGILAGIVVAGSAFVSSTAPAASDGIVIGMSLEPPGLDPTAGAAAAISEITLYNIFEGLTRIDERGEVGPGLATGWSVSDDGKSYVFTLMPGVKFADGSAFDSADVKFSFERNAAETSTNKRKARFQNMAEIRTPDPLTVEIVLKERNPLLLFDLGESTAVIVAPESAAANATNPVGTGPFMVDKWVKGDSVTLVRQPHYRDPGAVQLKRATFKFIGDANAQVAALLADDVDVFPRIGAVELATQFESDSRFRVLNGTTEGETVLSTNNKRKPLDDVRVRRAIAHALDRKEIIDGSEYGYAVPIGSHFAPHHPAYVDLTAMYPHDVAKAKALLAEAGLANGLELSLKLPPTGYAKRSGEIIAAQLAKVGIRITIENVQWAQWLDVVYKQKNYDLSIVSHVEPNDIDVYANPEYYFQYDSAAFRDLIAKADAATELKSRYAFLGQAQRKLAEDAVNGFLFQLAKVGVARAGIEGLWLNWPIFVNDLAAIRRAD